MGEEQPAKKARLDLEDAVNTFLDQADQLQAEIEKLNDEASEKILEVEREYNRKRRPKYVARAELIKKLPGFWQRVLSNSAIISSLMTDDDAKTLEYLDEVDVEDFDDIKSGYRIVFRFRDNPWFAAGALEKIFRFDEGGKLTITATTPEWKPNMCLTADTDLGVEEAEDRQHARSKGEWVSFFDWFRGDEGDEGGADAGADVVGRVIREEVWLDPLRYYRGRVEDDQGFVEVADGFADVDDEYDDGVAYEDEEGEDDEEGDEGYEEGDGGEEGEEFGLDDEEDP